MNSAGGVKPSSSQTRRGASIQSFRSASFKATCASPTKKIPDVLYARAVEMRERLLAQARDRLAGEPDKLTRFNELYEAARYYLPVTEDHNYYIDQVGCTVMRLPLLELGRRLARRNVTDEADDVFLLFMAEAREGLNGVDQRKLVDQRRDEMEEWAKVVPPPALGEPPEPTGDHFEEAMMKMFGVPSEPSATRT